MDVIEDVASYLQIALDESAEDPTAVPRALGVIARSGNMSELARRVGMSRDGLYKALSDQGNPTWTTVLKVSNALGLKLTFHAVAWTRPPPCPVRIVVLTVAMRLKLRTPSGAELVRITDLMSTWQTDPWVGHLHPGDLGWRTLVGAEATAEDLRVWSVGARTVAVGLIDDGVLRLALDLAAADDDDAAAHLACTLEDSAQDLFSDGEWLVEARGATALRRLLIASGWTDDEPWSPLALDLSVTRLPLPTRTLRVERVGLEAAEDWTSVHWSAFQGTPFTGERRDRFTSRWGTMLTGPLADRAQCLMGYDEQGQHVAVATVWSAGQGRPGLIEPMGVHRDHHGHGYGTAITVAGARALQLAGASSAVVAAEDSNPAVLATYRAAGFRSLGTVRDLRRG